MSLTAAGLQGTRVMGRDGRALPENVAQLPCGLRYMGAPSLTTIDTVWGGISDGIE